MFESRARRGGALLLLSPYALTPLASGLSYPAYSRLLALELRRTLVGLSAWAVSEMLGFGLVANFAKRFLSLDSPALFLHAPRHGES